MNIIITGASKGLGKAFAVAFASSAKNIFLCSRNLQELQAVETEINNINNQCIVHCKVVDVKNKEQVIGFGEFCLATAGTPNILINNAGNFLPGSIHNEADGILEEMIETNLYSAYHLTRSVLPAMMKGKTGHIFNICSVASIAAYPNGGSYSISKYALLGFNKNLRQELLDYNIKVTAVLPGAVYTNSWSGSNVDTGRIMNVEDIAEMVVAASKLSAKACVEEILIRPQKGDL